MVLVAHTQRRSWFPFGFRVAAVVLAGVGVGSSCADLPSQHCAPCQEKCPGDLECSSTIGKCVYDSNDRGCDDPFSSPPTSTATTSAVLTGQGGAAGEDSGSSNLTSDTSTGGASTGGTSTGGASTGGTSTGGTSAGGADSGGAAGDSGTTATSSTDAGSGGTDSNACDSGGCDPEILTTNFGPFCAGAAIEVLQLEAICACDSEEAQDARSFSWTFEDPPLGLIHTADGALSGTLAAGTHRVNVTAGTNGGLIQVEGEVVIEVVERCLVIFQSEEDTPGEPYLVASRLDTTKAANVPLIGGEAASLASFEVAPDGRHLAQIEATGAERQLQLFDLLNNEVVHLDDLQVDQYLAHAFSPNSHWLAVVEGPAEDPAVANLKVIDLLAEPAEVLDEYPIYYEGGLTWSTPDHVIYWSPFQYDYSAVHEVAVDDDIGISPPAHYESGMQNLARNPFDRFLVNEVGFLMVLTDRRCFLNRDAGECRTFSPFHALSPGLVWGTFLATEETMDLYLLSEVYSQEYPQATIETCDTIRAWSEDDSTLFCAVTQNPFVYQFESNGTLTQTPLQLTGGLSWNKRMAFSRTGDWLALTPKEEGLVVLPREEFDTRSLDDVMLQQLANESWDFFFTSDEGRLIVQRGSDLFVAHLDAQNLPPTFDDPVATDLVSPPVCRMDEWWSDPPTWCGAPKFRGNLVVSPDERHLGFVNAGQVTTADLTDDDYPLLEHGTLAPGCGSECIRFR